MVLSLQVSLCFRILAGVSPHPANSVELKQFSDFHLHCWCIFNMAARVLSKHSIRCGEDVFCHFTGNV